MLIGTNGSGKSSTLQFLGFVRSFATGKADDFFDERGWVPKDVRSKIPHSLPSVSASLLLESEDGASTIWQFSWSYSGTTMREAVWQKAADQASPRKILEYKNRALDSVGDEYAVRGVNIRGSILPLLDGDRNSAVYGIIKPVVDWARGITSLELLSPVAMRRMGRGEHADIGPRGEHLASFIANLPPAARSRIVGRLSEFYPVADVSTTRKKAGWVDMKISEKYHGIDGIGPSHISDGFLRLLALCTIPELPQDVSMILLDEVEDGIDPHILPDIIRRVKEQTPGQFIMTSHSPILVNYLDASEVLFVGRQSDGSVAVSPFSEFPSASEGLSYFGTGELWTMLTNEQLQLELRDQAPDTADAQNRFTDEFVASFARA